MTTSHVGPNHEAALIEGLQLADGQGAFALINALGTEPKTRKSRAASTKGSTRSTRQ